MNVDENQLIDILNAHKGILYKVMNVYSYDEEDRKDLEQEIIIQIWKSLKNFKNQSKLSTWIYRVALNVSISHNRNASTRNKINASINDVTINNIAATRQDDKGFKSQKLHEFTNKLDRFNKAIILLYLDDYSYEEIGEIVGITKGNVGVKINRIKQLLSKQFESQKIR